MFLHLLLSAQQVKNDQWPNHFLSTFVWEFLLRRYFLYVFFFNIFNCNLYYWVAIIPEWLYLVWPHNTEEVTFYTKNNDWHQILHHLTISLTIVAWLHHLLWSFYASCSQQPITTLLALPGHLAVVCLRRAAQWPAVATNILA